jgi:hypothetical protein
MLHSTSSSYSLFPRQVEHEMPEVQRPGSSRSMEQTCHVKMVEVEHKRARSDPPTTSHRSSFARLRRTISAPINPKPEDARESRSKTKETVRAPIKLVYQPEGLQTPLPTRSDSTDLKDSTRNFIRASLAAASHDGRGAALPPPPPPPGQHVPRPLSTLEEEASEAEALSEPALLPAIQLNNCKPWIPVVIESPTRAHTVAPPPLKLRAPIKEGATPPPPLVLNIPAKESRPVPAPVPAPAANPLPPANPSRPRTKKRVRFAPTSPEIITPASIKAVTRYRAQNPRPKHHPSWSAVFLLSAPSSENDSNNRPSTSPGPQPTPQQHPNTKSILRRSNSFQNMRQEAEDSDSDVEIKPLEEHVYLVINAAMQKNLKRLPRNKQSQQNTKHPRKNTPLPALPVFAETPPTPTHNPNPNYHDNDRTPRHARHAPALFPTHPATPPSPPLPLSSRKFRHPVVVNHPPSPPSSSSSSRNGSPASSRSSSSERDDMMFRMYAPEPLQISRVNVNSMKAGKKEERVGRTRPDRVSWRAVA